MLPRNRILLRQSLVMGGAVGVFGISFGVLAVAAGLTPAQACAMSLLVFGGGAQFAAVGVIGLGGSPMAAVASGLLLNGRYVAFGLAVADRLRHRLSRHSGGKALLVRIAAAHLVIDESSALAFAQADDAEAEQAFWGAGLAVFVLWNAGTALGAVAVTAIDPLTLGLDAALAALFLALLVPLVTSPAHARTAVAGGLIAVALVPVTPPGVPVIAAATALVAGMARPGERQEARS
jgi:4-azaleucine resistance transporter AzlC